MFGIGIGEAVVILVVIILLFGAKRIPEIARGLGRAMSEFKKARDSVERETNALISDAEKPAGDAEKTKTQTHEDAGKPDAG